MSTPSPAPGCGHVDDAPERRWVWPWTTWVHVAHRQTLRPHAHSLPPPSCKEDGRHQTANGPGNGIAGSNHTFGFTLMPDT
jgi:hypothetical protein